jgi:cell division protein FtsL
MLYLLFFLSIGLATALTLVIKRLQQRNKDYIVDKQKLQEVDRQLQEAWQKLQQRNKDYIVDQPGLFHSK